LVSRNVLIPSAVLIAATLARRAIGTASRAAYTSPSRSARERPAQPQVAIGYRRVRILHDFEGYRAGQVIAFPENRIAPYQAANLVVPA
jgi:hypothetical protein